MTILSPNARLYPDTHYASLWRWDETQPDDTKIRDALWSAGFQIFEVPGQSVIGVADTDLIIYIEPVKTDLRVKDAMKAMITVNAVKGAVSSGMQPLPEGVMDTVEDLQAASDALFNIDLGALLKVALIVGGIVLMTRSKGGN